MTATVTRRFAGANFAAAGLGRTQSFLSGTIANAKGDYLMGRDLATSRYNMADAATPLTVAGAPVFHARSADVGMSGSFDTGVGDNPDLTIIVALQYLVTAEGWLVTQFQQPDPFTNLDISFGTMRGYAANADGSTGTTNYQPFPNGLGANEPWIAAMRTTVTDASSYTIALDAFIHGARFSGTSAAIAKARGIGAGSFLMGNARGNNTFTDNFGLFGAGIIYGALSDADLIAEVQAITARFAAWGVTL